MFRCLASSSTVKELRKFFLIQLLISYISPACWMLTALCRNCLPQQPHKMKKMISRLMWPERKGSRWAGPFSAAISRIKEGITCRSESSVTEGKEKAWLCHSQPPCVCGGGLHRRLAEHRRSQPGPSARLGPAGALSEPVRLRSPSRSGLCRSAETVLRRIIRTR